MDVQSKASKAYLLGVKRMEYKRITKLSDLGTLHAFDSNGEEQPLCELTALDTDVLIRRLYELENKIESGELGDVKELKQELKAQEGAANTYRICFEERKYWREVAKSALKNLARFCAKGARCYLQSDEAVKERKRELYSEWIKQAEKELAEERKDD